MLTWPPVANRRGILQSPSSDVDNYQGNSAVSAPQKRPRFNREQGVAAAKVRSVAAYSALIMQVLLLLLLWQVLLLLLMQVRVPSPPRF